ncbi:MAG: DUF3311 domain-containing protein [Candidatus Polarisedimenticolia bacterium]
MTRAGGRLLAAGGLALLFVLHDDGWFWNDPRLVLGLPVGMTYHVAYCLAASVFMALLVRFAWPGHLDVNEREPR